MKQQIEKLVKLAEEYVEYARDAGMGDGWVTLRGVYCDKKGDDIKIYSTPDNKWAIRFSNIEIAFYSEMIYIPYTYGAIELHEIYEDAKQFLETLRNELETKRKLTRISELEEELKKLKDSLIIKN